MPNGEARTSTAHYTQRANAAAARCPATRASHPTAPPAAAPRNPPARAAAPRSRQRTARCPLPPQARPRTACAAQNVRQSRSEMERRQRREGWVGGLRLGGGALLERFRPRAVAAARPAARAADREAGEEDARQAADEQAAAVVVHVHVLPDLRTATAAARRFRVTTPFVSIRGHSPQCRARARAEAAQAAGATSRSRGAGERGARWC